jgi:hypothetical protein
LNGPIRGEQRLQLGPFRVAPSSCAAAGASACRVRVSASPHIGGPYAISGVVAEGGRSIAGANVNAFVNQGNFGYSYMASRLVSKTMEPRGRALHEAAQGHWVLSSQEGHSCDGFAERIQTIKLVRVRFSLAIGYRSRLLSAFGVLEATGGRDAPSKVLGSWGDSPAYDTTIDDFRRRCRIGLQPGATVGTVGAGLSIGMLHG